MHSFWDLSVKPIMLFNSDEEVELIKDVIRYLADKIEFIKREEGK